MAKKSKTGREPSGKLRVPVGMVPGISHMEINGNREVVVEGCSGVLESVENTVRVKFGKLQVRFTGRGMSIKCLTADSLVVEGFLTGIEFMT